jgi:hypothetical protein
MLWFPKLTHSHMFPTFNNVFFFHFCVVIYFFSPSCLGFHGACVFFTIISLNMLNSIMWSLTILFQITQLLSQNFHFFTKKKGVAFFDIKVVQGPISWCNNQLFEIWTWLHFIQLIIASSMIQGLFFVTYQMIVGIHN